MIVVAGDSWACGEWTVITNGKNYISDPGLTGLIAADGHQVLNIAQPGASLVPIADRLRDHLRQNAHIKTDLALVVPTEFTRDPWFFHPSWDQGYRASRDTLLHAWYARLEDMAREYDLRIALLGGIGETLAKTDLADQYPRLKCVCQSITNLIINDAADVKDPCLAAWDHSNKRMIEIMKSRGTLDEIEELMHAMDLAESRTEAWRANKQWFYPDGIHPNRHAQRKLYDYIKPILGL